MKFLLHSNIQVYANSEERFESCLQTLKQQNEGLFQYVSKNWVVCKDMWASYLRSSVLTLGNDANQVNSFMVKSSGQNRSKNGQDAQTDKQTDRRTHRLLHINFFGHVELVASGLTLLQPIIKNVHTDTVNALQPCYRRLVITIFGVILVGRQ